MKNFIRYLIIVGLIICFSIPATSHANDLGNSPKSSTMIHRGNNKQLDVTLKPFSQNGDEIVLELTLKGIYGPLKGDLHIHVQVGKKITLKSPNKIEEHLNGEQKIKHTIELSVPKGVSSSVSVMAISNSYPFGGRSRLFIRNIADTMEYSIFPFPAPKVVPLNQEPIFDTMSIEQLEVEYEYYVLLKDEEQYSYVESLTDTLISTYKNNIYKTKLNFIEFQDIGEKGYEVGFVHRPPWDKRTTPWENLETSPDTIPYIPITRIMHLTDSEVLNKRKQLAEEYVLTDKPNESFYIDGVMWQRNKGEQFFREIEPITDTKAFMKHINDSLAALPDSHLFELCLLIPEELKPKAINILGKLPEPIENDFYHLSVRKGDLPKLQEAGIRVSFIKNTICNHSISSSDNGSKKN